MPAEVLTEAEADPDDTRPVAGFFGKLPSTGDFVSRGLPDAFRRNWDAWITRHVAPLQREGLAFPEGGLRFHLPSGGRLAAGVILPSEDSAGRQFPLTLLLVADGGLTPAQTDSWCDAALGLLTSDTPDPDSLWHALDALPAAAPEGTATGPLTLWTAGHQPQATTADTAEETLRQLFTGA
jgi:type VI secretion system protein ImpM